MVNKDRVLREFYELAKIYCASGTEREVADVVKTKLTGMGLVVTEDNVQEQFGGNCGNVIALFKGNVPDAPAVMFNAHLDCVQPCAGIEPVLKDGVITSAGDTILGADDKAGVVTILEALRVITETGARHGDVEVIFTVCEDGGLKGSKYIDKAGLKAQFGYSLDSGGAPGEIVTMAPGQNSITATVYGKTSHAGLAPEAGINAIVVAGRALAELKQGRIDFETTANVGVISGGVATNIVPDKVVMKCEARSRNLAKLDAQTAHMKETFERIAAAHGARAEVIVEKAYDPFVVPEDAPVVKLFTQAADSVGFKVNITASGGGSDANYFNAYGVSTAVLGVGMSKAHTTAEYIKEEHLYQSAEMVLAIIKTIAAK